MRYKNESKRPHKRIGIFLPTRWKSEVLAYLYDKETNTEYECDFKVDGDIIPILVLEEVGRREKCL